MLLNISNHPSNDWPLNQKLQAIKQYGSVADLPFPPVDPGGDVAYIENLADEYLQLCINKLGGSEYNKPSAVHIMGELTFCFALVTLLQMQQITCIASTTRRVASHDDKGNKQSVFSFVKFREYPQLNDMKSTAKL
jgi:hypothetical protein